MKRYISVALTVILFATGAWAQSKSAYFMDGYNYRHDLNPAMSPYRGYINLLGHYAVNVNSNLSVPQLFFPSQDGELLSFLHPDVAADQFLDGLSDNNILNLNTGIDVLGFGFNSGRSYFSFDTKLNVAVSSNLPKTFFAFLKKGMDSDHTVYDIRNLNVSATAYASAGIGYAYQLLDNLRLGVKGRYLLGLAGASANIDQMLIDMSGSGWNIQTQASLNAYCPAVNFKYGEDGTGNAIDDYITGLAFDMESLRPAGHGLAFDLGVEYSPIKNLSLSLAVTNLGGIKWNEDACYQASSTGEVSFSGIELELNKSTDETGAEAGGEESTGDMFKQLSDDMLKMIQFRKNEIQESQIQRLDSRFLAGIQYGIFNNRLSAGLLYTLDHTAYGDFNELIASANIGLLKDLQLSGSYTLLSDYGRAFGLALNLGSLLYISWDHILTDFSPQYIPLNTLTTQVEVGLRIPFGKPKKLNN